MEKKITMQYKNKNRLVCKDDISIALVWTKYQYHILLALLRELGIDRSSVRLIVFSKAQRQGVTGEGFLETVYYNSEEYKSLKDWPQIKQDIFTLMKSFDFNINKLFIRSYDSAIGRILMSEYSDATVYLFEDGTTSYKRRNYLGYPCGLKEALRNFFLRFYFGSGLLKVLPLLRKNVIKSGLFPSVDPWLNVPYLRLKLLKEDLFTKDVVLDKQPNTHKVLILEQPLWQAGFDDDMLIYAYREMLIYTEAKYDINKVSIALKMHPSSDKNRVIEILRKAKLEDKIEILDKESNLEEMIFSGELSSLKMIIGFYSSGIYLAKSLLDEKNIDNSGIFNRKT